mmetsp:Transcript_14683/g.35447  ORF Transcript_14683/g.35447 Transcript_14683/m.35447 type:complete len:202 (+) Transcript_14683:421-1026(+)
MGRTGLCCLFCCGFATSYFRSHSCYTGIKFRSSIDAALWWRWWNHSRRWWFLGIVDIVGECACWNIIFVFKFNFPTTQSDRRKASPILIIFFFIIIVVVILRNNSRCFPNGRDSFLLSKSLLSEPLPPFVVTTQFLHEFILYREEALQGFLECLLIGRSHTFQVVQPFPGLLCITFGSRDFIIAVYNDIVPSVTLHGRLIL